LHGLLVVYLVFTFILTKKFFVFIFALKKQAILSFKFVPQKYVF